jgi:hypothetical protein
MRPLKTVVLATPKLSHSSLVISTYFSDCSILALFPSSPPATAQDKYPTDFLRSGCIDRIGSQLAALVADVKDAIGDNRTLPMDSTYMGVLP